MPKKFVHTIHFSKKLETEFHHHSIHKYTTWAHTLQVKTPSEGKYIF